MLTEAQIDTLNRTRKAVYLEFYEGKNGLHYYGTKGGFAKEWDRKAIEKLIGQTVEIPDVNFSSILGSPMDNIALAAIINGINTNITNINNTISSLTTDDITEGVTNLYFTQTRARQSISETITGIDYDNTSGIFSMTAGYQIPQTTDFTSWNAKPSGAGVNQRVAYWTAADTISYNDNFRYNGSDINLMNSTWIYIWNSAQTRYTNITEGGVYLEDFSSGTYHTLRMDSFPTGNVIDSSTQLLFTTPAGIKMSYFAGVGTRYMTVDVNGVLGSASLPTDLVTGTGAANRVAFWTGAQTLDDSANLTYDLTTLGLTGKLSVIGTSTAVAGLTKHAAFEPTLVPSANFDRLAAVYIKPVLSNPGGYSLTTATASGLYGVYVDSTTIWNYLGAGIRVGSVTGSYNEFGLGYIATSGATSFQMRIGDNFLINNAAGTSASTIFIANQENIAFFSGSSTLGGGQSYKILFRGSKTAVTNVGRYMEVTPTIVASGAGGSTDQLAGIYLAPVFTRGVHTVIARAFRIDATASNSDYGIYVVNRAISGQFNTTLTPSGGYFEQQVTTAINLTAIGGHSKVVKNGTTSPTGVNLIGHKFETVYNGDAAIAIPYVLGTQVTFGTDVDASIGATLAVGSTIALSHLTVKPFTYTKTVGLQIGNLTGGTQAANSVYSIESTDSSARMYHAGDIEVYTVGKNVIMKSPDGTRWRVGVTNAGAISITLA